jgi:hypothetical protein
MLNLKRYNGIQMELKKVMYFSREEFPPSNPPPPPLAHAKENDYFN